MYSPLSTASKLSYKSPIQRGVAALTGLKGLIYTSSSLKARMASQGRDGIGETCQSTGDNQCQNPDGPLNRKGSNVLKD